MFRRSEDGAWRHGWLGALLPLVFLGCAETIEEEESALGTLRQDCVVPVPSSVRALAGPVSIEYPDSSLWIWPVVETADGELAVNVGAKVREASEICETGPALLTGSEGRPLSLLTLDEEELEHERTRSDGKQLWLSPTGGFVHEGDAYVFYELLEGTNLLETVSLGTGLCVLAPDSSECVRVEQHGSPALWASGERDLNQGGLVAEGRGFVYGCRRVAALSSVCTVSAAPLEQLTVPAAYQVAGIEDWVDNLLDAAVVTEELGPVTVSSYWDGYLLTTLDPFEQRVLVRRSSNPAGEFERRIDLFGIARTEGEFPSGGREHAGLRRGPHELHVSYAVERGGHTELHLATFELNGPQIGGTYQPPRGDER